MTANTKKRLNWWKIFNWIGFVVVLIGILFFVRGTSWGSLTKVEVIGKCGVIGGLLYISDYFWREVKER